MANSDGGQSSQTMTTRELAQELYDLIRHTANRLMHECQSIPIEVLAKRDPSLDEIAQNAEKLGKIINALAIDFDPMLAQKAFDYALLMTQIAVAVRNHDQVRLSRLVIELRSKPGT